MDQPGKQDAKKFSFEENIASETVISKLTDLTFQRRKSPKHGKRVSDKSNRSVESTGDVDSHQGRHRGHHRHSGHKKHKAKSRFSDTSINHKISKARHAQAMRNSKETADAMKVLVAALAPSPDATSTLLGGSPRHSIKSEHHHRHHRKSVFDDRKDGHHHRKSVFDGRNDGHHRRKSEFNDTKSGHHHHHHSKKRRRTEIVDKDIVEKLEKYQKAIDSNRRDTKGKIEPESMKKLVLSANMAAETVEEEEAETVEETETVEESEDLEYNNNIRRSLNVPMPLLISIDDITLNTMKENSPWNFNKVKGIVCLLKTCGIILMVKTVKLVKNLQSNRLINCCQVSAFLFLIGIGLNTASEGLFEYKRRFLKTNALYTITLGVNFLQTAFSGIFCLLIPRHLRFTRPVSAIIIQKIYTIFIRKKWRHEILVVLYQEYIHTGNSNCYVWTEH